MEAESWYTLIGWLATIFGIVRVVSVVGGVWFQALVTLQRYHERKHVCHNPDAPVVECAIQSWHLERGYLLLGVHILLAALSAVAFVGRSAVVLSDVPLELLVVRIVGDLLFTAAIVVLALVSLRARYHHDRIMRLINRMARKEVASQQELADLRYP